MKLNKSKKGFTIVELVIVIGVIGILSAILIPTFVNLTEKAKTAAMKEECAQAYSAYAAEAADGVIDDHPDVNISFLKQEEIVLVKGEDKYEFNGEWGELRNTFEKGELVAGAYSTYNSYTVYTKVAAE